MKRNVYNKILTVFLVLTAFTLASCEKMVLRGHGDDVTRTRTVGSFDEIEMGGEFEVYLSQGAAEDIVLEGQENVLSDIRTITRNNKLEIDFRSHRVKITKPVRVYITTPDLKALSFSGSNSVRGLTNWHVHDLDLKTSGSGKINLTVLGANYVKSQISGSGEITLNGDAYEHDLNISGSGRLSGFGFYTTVSNVKISGSGKGEVRVSERLNAEISGSGKVYYKGNPTVNVSVSGSGKVSKRD